MRLVPGPLAGLVLVEPDVHADLRGTFAEVWRAGAYPEASFVQDNLSRSRRGVLRGLHYQVGLPQAKLITVAHGTIYDVAVDLRRSSATFGRAFGTVLSEENHHQLFVPEGFAHGFLVLSEWAHVWYKVTAARRREGERVLAWNDPALAIDWPLTGPPIVSPRDAAAPGLDEAELFP